MSLRRLIERWARRWTAGAVTVVAVGVSVAPTELGVLGFNRSATIALWIRRSAAPAITVKGEVRPEYQEERDRRQGRLLSVSAGSPGQGLAGSLRVGPEKLEVWQGKGWATLVAGSLPSEAWTHVAVVFDATCQATRYLNGRRCETVACVFDGAKMPMELVAAAYGRHDGFPFAGAIDDVRLYRGALNDAEVRQPATSNASLATQRE